MKANLVGELKSTLQKRKQDTETNGVLKEAQKLLENDRNRDVDMIQKIAPNCALSQMNDERGKIIELERHENFYAGNVFSYDQIIDLGVKYRLKFLPASKFTGYIDPAAIVEIRDMEKCIKKSMTEKQAAKMNISLEEYVTQYGESNFSIDDSELRRNFFILAPASMFKLNKKDAWQMQKDPVMFYRIDDNHYRLIRKWGSDFSVLRRVKGFVTKSEMRQRFFVFILPLIIISLTLSVFIDWWWALMNLLCLIPLLAGEYENDFFNKKHVTSDSKYFM